MTASPAKIKHSDRAHGASHPREREETAPELYPRPAACENARMGVVGSTAPRKEGPEKLCGLAKYVDDLVLPHCQKAMVTRSLENGVFSITANRIGTEAPWNIGEFYGSSYFANPRVVLLPEDPPVTRAMCTPNSLLAQSYN